jgi:hypothetical protein
MPATNTKDGDLIDLVNRLKSKVEELESDVKDLTTQCSFFHSQFERYGHLYGMVQSHELALFNLQRQRKTSAIGALDTVPNTSGSTIRGQ